MIEDISLRALCEIVLIRTPNRPVIRIQNWEPSVLSYQNKPWNYAPFPLPELSRKLGSDTQSVSVRLPNYTTAVSGNTPVGTWAQDGSLAGAKVLFITFSDEPGMTQRHRFTVQERIFEESGDPTRSGTLEILLRSTEDGLSQILSQVYSINNIYQSLSSSPV
jgi:hypothetical protein